MRVEERKRPGPRRHGPIQTTRQWRDFVGETRGTLTIMRYVEHDFSAGGGIWEAHCSTCQQTSRVFTRKWTAKSLPICAVCKPPRLRERSFSQNLNRKLKRLTPEQNRLLEIVLAGRVRDPRSVEEAIFEVTAHPEAVVEYFGKQRHRLIPGESGSPLGDLRHLWRVTS